MKHDTYMLVKFENGQPVAITTAKNPDGTPTVPPAKFEWVRVTVEEF